MRRRGVAGRRGAELARVTGLAVLGLVVALCLPTVGQRSAGESPGASTGVVVRGVDGSR
ncbi:MAG: hypothetical protein HOV84_28490 [Streptomyces sp.]|nr:hypothetical protein [Streptomyces sp.]